jgi:hypothetical protein
MIFWVDQQKTKNGLSPAEKESVIPLQTKVKMDSFALTFD